MIPTAVAAPVWYEPGPPPTAHPLLASETDVPGLCVDVEPLCRQELDMTKAAATLTPTVKSIEKRRKKTTFVARSRTPPEDLQLILSSSEQGPISDSDSDSASSSESEPESQDDAAAKIAKPPGEVGRPGRGGYSLERVLDLTPRRMSEFKKLINKLVGEYLDPTRSVSSQPASRMALVRDKALQKFAELDQYENAWPVTDAVKQRLKYTSSKARKHAHDAVASGGQKRKEGKKLRSRRRQDD